MLYTIAPKQTVAVYEQGAVNLNGVYVKNLGTSAFELRQTPGASGFPLGAGSAVSWSGSLYLYSDAGGSAYVDAAIGASFDASAVATQIMGQGLAQAIAGAIAITGAPPVDKFALIDNGQAVACIVGTIITRANIDTSSYRSVRVAWADQATLTSDYGQVREVLFQWRNPADGVITVVESYYYYINGEYVYINSPVKGGRLDIVFRDAPAPSLFVSDVVFGSYAEAPSPAFRQDIKWGSAAINWQAGGPEGNSAHFMPSAAGNVQVGGRSGRARLSVDVPTTAGQKVTASQGLPVGVNSQPVAQVTATAGQIAAVEFIQGNGPITISWVLGGGSLTGFHIAWLDY